MSVAKPTPSSFVLRLLSNDGEQEAVQAKIVPREGRSYLFKGAKVVTGEFYVQEVVNYDNKGTYNVTAGWIIPNDAPKEPTILNVQSVVDPYAT